MIGKLNTRLFDHTQNVADHNGWKVLRVIIEFMDMPPSNAKFQMEMKLKQLIQDKEGKSIICLQECQGRDEDHSGHRERNSPIP